jgi:hypothetical protein
MSDIPPEVLFHRYFQDPARPSCYRGKFDVGTQAPNVGSALTDIQTSYNEALNTEYHDTVHRDQPRFHFDYIDSDVQNALAFGYAGYSFIGITSALVGRISEICLHLSRSKRVAASLCARLAPEGCEAVHTVLFRIALNFVVSHEYAHHLNGDIDPVSGSTVFNEITDEDNVGDLDRQALELDADAYAAIIVLGNIVERGERQTVVRLLRLEAESVDAQDEVLYSCFIVGVGGYLFTRPPTTLDRQVIYRLTHPPQSLRMNFLMQAADSWCRQKRPALLDWMTEDRFDKVMTTAAEVGWVLNGRKDWAAQVAFILSECGAEYRRRLHDSLKRRYQKPTRGFSYQTSVFLEPA